MREIERAHLLLERLWSVVSKSTNLSMRPTSIQATLVISVPYSDTYEESEFCWGMSHPVFSAFDSQWWPVS